MNWLKSMLTGADGTIDDARVHASLLVISYIGTAVYSIHNGHAFDPQAYGVGAGALAAGVGGWFGLRKGN